MRISHPITVTMTLGELVTTAFARAERATRHPVLAPPIATRLVRVVLERSGRRDLVRSLAETAGMLAADRGRIDPHGPLALAG